MSWLHLRGSTLLRAVLLASLLAAITLGSCNLFRIPTSSGWLAPSAGIDSAHPVRGREVDVWLPVSLSCRRVERFASSP